MIIKHSGFRTTALNRFDLLGTDEIGLSKTFAYLLAVYPPILFRFLRELGVQVKHTDTNVKNTTIHIERKRQEGRTDIEICQTGKYHVIVESRTKEPNTALVLLMIPKMSCVLSPKNETAIGK